MGTELKAPGGAEQRKPAEVEIVFDAAGAVRSVAARDDAAVDGLLNAWHRLS
ncbi:MAG: hypothetical protein WB507_12740 [Solirubrobacterales bacterium]